MTTATRRAAKKKKKKKKATARKSPARRQADELPSKTTAEKTRARRLYKALLQRYPDAHCELDFRNPHELLAAVILSAQATDVGVNKATPALFQQFATPADFARSTPETIEEYVRSLGFFRNKAKAIHEAMTRISEHYGGEVPRTMEDLLTLRGVARKTANVVLGNAFGINEGVVVDTHVIRLSQRMGLTTHSDPGKIERDLMALFPRRDWTMLSHLLIFHGRRVCKARGALCADDSICRRYCSNARPDGGGRTTGGARKAPKKKLTKKKVTKKRTGKKTGRKTTTRATRS
jgi:endonuclease-3